MVELQIPSKFALVQVIICIPLVNENAFWNIKVTIGIINFQT